MRLIDGDKAVQRFKNYQADCEKENDTLAAEIFADVVAELQDAPAIDPVKHGNWIVKPYLFGTSRFCSKCGSNYGMPHEIYNYCPNCGVKMDKEDT